MARSTGFKRTKNIRNFLRILGVNEILLEGLGITEAQAVSEIRNITDKYQPLEQIQGDLEEMDKQVQNEEQSSEPVAANDNGQS